MRRSRGVRVIRAAVVAGVLGLVVGALVADARASARRSIDLKLARDRIEACLGVAETLSAANRRCIDRLRTARDLVEVLPPCALVPEPRFAHR